MKITDDKAISAFLQAANVVPAREEGWFDAEQASELFGGYSMTGTLKKLSDAVKAGRLECRQVYDRNIGKIRKVWRPVEDQEQDFNEMDVVHTCGDCGTRLQSVRPGKWQCPECN